MLFISAGRSRGFDIPLTSQKLFHSPSHFITVPSVTLTNCLKSCSFAPIVCCTLLSFC